MKKLGFIALVLLSLSGVVLANNIPTNQVFNQAAFTEAPAPAADVFSQAVFTKAPAPSAVFDSITGNQPMAGISQCEIDCWIQFTVCLHSGGGPWLACEITAEHCAGNCN